MHATVKTLLFILVFFIIACGGGSGGGSSPEPTTDTDRDGIADAIDPDDDNDGVMDAADAFPFDPNESADFDQDGTGDNADSDDDNDGVADVADAFPTDPDESADFDRDGTGDNADSDDDNDGIADADDPRPFTRPRMVTVSGQFLTSHPRAYPYRVKILFALDCSLSMIQSDPARQRFAAVRDFINRYNTPEHPHVSFAILLWSGAIDDQTLNDAGDPGYTRSAAELNRVLDNPVLSTYTDYLQTLDLVGSMVRNDIDTVLTQPSGAADLARTRYIVCFLIDGGPNTDTGVQVAEDIWNEVDSLSQIAETRGAGSFNLHALFLSALFRDASGNPLQDSTTVEMRERIEAILAGMAQRGDGTFHDHASAQDIVFDGAPFMNWWTPYTLRSLNLFNLNVRPDVSGLQEDSDADGITDAHELSPLIPWWFATNPQEADTDADGLKDGCELEAAYSGHAQDPTTPDSAPCSPLHDGTFADSDGDGLNDCEENILQTDLYLADTDRDVISDQMEVLFGSDPLESSSVDTDLDGATDWTEIRAHTNPRMNDPLIRDRYSYSYEITNEGCGDPYPDQCLYSFRVSNIAILDTGGSTVGGNPDLSNGENRIHIVLGEVPEDQPGGPPVMRTAQAILDYHDEDNEFVILPSDFQAME